MRWGNLIVGSIAGGLSRYLLAGTVYKTWGTDFPYGTLVVNLSGCFLIGLFYALAEVKFLLGPSARLLLMTGFCGAFTTFSTLIFETNQLLSDGQIIRAAMNLLVSLVAGLILFRLGEWTGQL